MSSAKIGGYFVLASVCYCVRPVDVWLGAGVAHVTPEWQWQAELNKRAVLNTMMQLNWCPGPS